VTPRCAYISALQQTRHWRRRAHRHSGPRRGERRPRIDRRGQNMRRRRGASPRCATLRSWWRPHGSRMESVSHRRICVANEASITRCAALRPRHHSFPPRCATDSPSVRGCAAAPTRRGAVAVAVACIRVVGTPAVRRLFPTSATGGGA